MDVLKLRIMTRKSQLKAGKYVGVYVDTLLNIDSRYLVWCYYNLSKISFVEEILDELCIIPSLRISKPGKVSRKEFKELNYKRLQILKQKIGEEKYMHEGAHEKAVRNRNITARANFHARETPNKSRLYNQGHRRKRY